MWFQGRFLPFSYCLEKSHSNQIWWPNQSEWNTLTYANMLCKDLLFKVDTWLSSLHLETTVIFSSFQQSTRAPFPSDPHWPPCARVSRQPCPEISPVLTVLTSVLLKELFMQPWFPPASQSLVPWGAGWREGDANQTVTCIHRRLYPGHSVPCKACRLFGPCSPVNEDMLMTISVASATLPQGIAVAPLLSQPHMSCER